MKKKSSTKTLNLFNQTGIRNLSGENMAIVIETFLMCDVCNETFGVDNRERTGTEHRKKAKLNGWQYSNNIDQCPNCRPKTKTGNIIQHKPKTKQ